MLRSRRIRADDGTGIRAARTPRLVASVAVASALILSACAPEPGTLTFATPPAATPAESGIGVTSEPTAPATGTPAEPDAAPAPGSGPGSGSGSDAGAAPSAPAAGDRFVSPTSTVTAPRGLLPERIRNTRARLSARVAYVPGVPRFTRLVDREIRSAIRLSGRGFTPQAFPVGSGLGDRGCIPGSSRWTAGQTLRRAATAPPRRRGVAVTCDVIGASGEVIRIAMRTVQGSAVAGEPTRIIRDRTRVFYADVETGAAGEVIPSELWRDSAPRKLWRRAVKQLIAGAGGTVSVPLADPGPAQLRLAQRALLTARVRSDLGLAVTLPAGIRAPELAALGIPRTAGPTVVTTSSRTADIWSRELGVLLRHNAGKRFVGVRAKESTVDLDCRLLTCVALTYDDGPSPYTAGLLATMRAERARITLFMLGPSAQARPGTVRRALADGQEIGSHTMHHPDLTTLSLRAANAEVKDAAAILRRIGQRPITFYRPPYGAIDQRIIDRIGMPAILWNVDTNDWREPGRSALIQRSVPVVAPGGIILFHDTHADSVAVAGTVVKGLRDRGFETVTVSQLFGARLPVARISGRSS